MKKSLSLRMVLFVFISFFLSISISNAAGTGRAFTFWGNFNPTPFDVQAVFGAPAYNIDIALDFMNHGNRNLTNIRFYFYDANGNNVCADGAYYQYPNEIAAHGVALIDVRDLVQNHSTTKFCSIEITWDDRGDVKPQILIQGSLKDVGGNFLSTQMLFIYNPTY
jgi:hypothetical protein